MQSMIDETMLLPSSSGGGGSSSSSSTSDTRKSGAFFSKDPKQKHTNDRLIKLIRVSRHVHGKINHRSI